MLVYLGVSHLVVGKIPVSQWSLDCLTPVQFASLSLLRCDCRQFQYLMAKLSQWNWNRFPIKCHQNAIETPMINMPWIRATQTNGENTSFFSFIVRRAKQKNLFEFHSLTAHHPYSLRRQKYIEICAFARSGRTNSIPIGLLLFMSSRSSSINTWFSVVVFHYGWRLIISRSFSARQKLETPKRCAFIQKIAYWIAKHILIVAKNQTPAINKQRGNLITFME